MRQTRTPHPEFELRTEMRFAALPTAVFCAQMFVDFTLRGWRLTDIAERAHQVTTELVHHGITAVDAANAGTPSMYGQHIYALTVRLGVIENRLIVEVEEGDSQPAPDIGALPAVQAICQRWNSYCPQGGNRITWCELLLSAQFASSIEKTQELRAPLPKRTPNRSLGLVPPIEVMNDLRMLGRIRDGLLDIADEQPEVTP